MLVNLCNVCVCIWCSLFAHQMQVLRDIVCLITEQWSSSSLGFDYVVVSLLFEVCQRLFNLKNHSTSFLQKALIGIEMPNNNI